jgi:hypothetical protein
MENPYSPTAPRLPQKLIKITVCKQNDFPNIFPPEKRKTEKN